MHDFKPLRSPNDEDIPITQSDGPRPVIRPDSGSLGPKDGGGSTYKGTGDAEIENALNVSSEEGEIDPRLMNPAENKTVVAGTGPGASSKIRTFQQNLGGVRHEDTWQRTPNVTGSGAIHVRSFHCKLTGDSLTYLDQQINEWLDAHPQYEVKLVTTSIGTWTGKNKEPHLIMNVWV